MSTQTSALPDGTTLTKPASGEKVSLSVINTNTDNIANNIIAINNHVNANWFGNNTLSNIQSALFNFAQNMPDGGFRVIEFGISQATGNFGATNYIGKLERISASRLCVTVMNAMYATNMIIGNYKDSTWNWAEVALVSQINTLNSKTIYTGTENSNYIGALEGQVVKNGSFVSGYFVLTANTDFSAANLTLISNLPAAYNQDIQLSCTGLSGTNIYKASRVKITTNGTIVTWYGFGFKSGESYLISVNYICA